MNDCCRTKQSLQVAYNNALETIGEAAFAPHNCGSVCSVGLYLALLSPKSVKLTSGYTAFAVLE